MSESRGDEALALAQLPHVCEVELLHAIARKLPAERNAEAVPLLLRVFAANIAQASSPYREELALVAETAARQPQPELQQWLALLRAEFKAKRNFIKGLDALKTKFQ